MGISHRTKTQDWQGVFLHFDRDRSGTIDGNELQAALSQFGYKLSPNLLNLLQRKYGAHRSHSSLSLSLFVRAHLAQT
jgi:Ca2+-binding EF-hand superfamily protein